MPFTDLEVAFLFSYCALIYTFSILMFNFCFSVAVLTHSASIAQIKYIFKYLVPSIRDKTLLDIGSRTGALLYGVGWCCNLLGILVVIL